MKLIDLFGGGGLASWGFQNLGIEALAAVDISPAACSAYQANFPNSAVFQDKVSNSISRLCAIAPLDCLLHLSPPCQSFSAAANINRKKVRPSIASEIDASIELIRQIKPLLISLEEVPRFSKSAEAEKLRLVLWKLGY
ncbi:MAG: DNA cytosine methyltransferase [Oscillatoria sp. SIO1A7]|nr:DNA cytosine methyltransferase [Oscillatoria sp. SIO1A7]